MNYSTTKFKLIKISEYNFKMKEVEVKEPVKCACGQTKDPNGNCDGSHKNNK